eukprot:scaffold39110_cov45-Phaeocystis_antarctica.AAC.2
MSSLFALDREGVFCRVAKRAYCGLRARRREAAGDRGARSVHQGRGLDCRFGAGLGEERTLNIWFMVVTLEVSKLSGWLNADACCRDERRAYGACEVQSTGRLEVVGRPRCKRRARKGSTADWEQGTGRSARRT